MIILGDCLEELKKLEENSIDAVVTDPPYGLSFMGKKWDYDVPSIEIWQECLRVLKPGGYLLAFAGTRTQHRMAVRIEDAGFEIRDMIAWVYGSGFPKSLNIGKAVDKMEGTEYPKNTLISENGSMSGGNYTRNTREIASELGKEWEGWGTALKPALEPITVARKPIEGNVAQNCLKWGVGGINIDGCRVEYQGEADKASSIPGGRITTKGYSAGTGKVNDQELNKEEWVSKMSGRFPANLIHDGSVEVLSLFPMTKSGAMNSIAKGNQYNVYGKMYERQVTNSASSGSAARFFYCAKASKSERNRGCEGLEEKIQNNTETNSRTFNDRCLTCKKKFVGSDNTICHCPPELKITDKTIYTNKNNHPTVKPVALMEYLVKLVSREGSLVLDPFAGSGSTGIACQNLNRDFILIEREPSYVEIIKARLND